MGKIGYFTYFTVILQTPVKLVVYLFYIIYVFYVNYAFYQYFTYSTGILHILVKHFTTPCNFQSTKTRRGWQKKALEYGFFFFRVQLCSPGSKIGSVWLRSLVIRTIKCIIVQLIIILKWQNFSWNEITLVLWTVKDRKDYN